MPEERLLERLLSCERNPLRRERPDQGRLVQSILAHLRCILNTRHGAVPAAPAYGMPDFTGLLQRYPDSVGEIETGIRRAIELYEPRLESVRVSFREPDDNSLSLRFQVQGRLGRDGSSPVSFDTVVASDGKISVEY